MEEAECGREEDIQLYLRGQDLVSLLPLRQAEQVQYNVHG